MDYVTAFNKLREEIVKVDSKKLSGNFAIQVTMTDPDCHGIFYISCFDGVVAAEPFDYVDNTAAIRLTKLSLTNLLSGRSQTEKLIQNGKVEISGDAKVVKEFFRAMPKKEKNVRKTTRKK